MFLPGTGGVLVVDVRDPARPTRLGILPTGGDAAVDVAVQDGLVYVAAGDGGLYVFAPDVGGWPTPELQLTPSPTTGVEHTATPTRLSPTSTAVSTTPIPAATRRAFLPVALRYGELPAAPSSTAEPTATAPATATPLPTSTSGPTPTAGTPGTSTPTVTPGSASPQFLFAAGDVSRPDVAGDDERTDCRQLVVWIDTGTTEGAIWGRFVQPDGLGEPFLVSGEAGAFGPPAVAYSAGLEQWLAVWPAPDEQRVSALRGRLIGCPAPDG